MIFTKCFTVKTVAFLLPMLLCLSLCMGCAREPEELEIGQAEAPIASELPIPNGEGGQNDSRTLNIAYVKYDGTFHPLANLEEDIANLFSLIFEPAIKISADGKYSASVIEAWTIEEDGKKFIFNVRKGVVSHDGSNITADDLAFTANKIRSLNPADCPYAKYKDKVVAVEKTGDYQLTVTLSEPTKDIYYFMSFPVLPKGYYENAELTSRKEPKGTGPYQVESYSKEKGFQFVVNENWWKTPPLYKTISAKPVDSEEEKMENFKVGLSDTFTTSLPTVNSYSAEKNTKIHAVVTPEYIALVPNFRNSLLNDQSVRKAISLAIDRSDVITNSVAGAGLATETPLRPDLWYFKNDKDIINGYNLNQAAKLLDEAGYEIDEETGLWEKSGAKLSFDVIYVEADDLYYRRSILDTVKKQLREAGIELNIIEKNKQEYKTAMESGDFDLALAAYYTNTNNDIRYIFENNSNYGSFSSDELLKLANDTMSAVKEEDLQTAYSALSAYLVNQLPHIGLFFREHALVTKGDLQISGMLKFKNVYANMADWK